MSSPDYNYTIFISLFALGIYLFRKKGGKRDKVIMGTFLSGKIFCITVILFGLQLVLFKIVFLLVMCNKLWDLTAYP